MPTNLPPNRPPLLAVPTIAAVPRTFEAQNRRPRSQQQSSSWLVSGSQPPVLMNHNLDDIVDDDDDDGIVDVTARQNQQPRGRNSIDTTTANNTIAAASTAEEQQQAAAAATAIALWRERERRQRTIRVFVMFLLMLLLMEEEPNSSSVRHPSNNHRLRGAASNNSQTRNHKILRYQSSSEVYKSRRVQDDHIRLLGRHHPRYSALIDKQAEHERRSLNYNNNGKQKTFHGQPLGDGGITITPNRKNTAAGDGTATEVVGTGRQEEGDEVMMTIHDYNEEIVQWGISISDMEKDEFDRNDNIPSTTVRSKASSTTTTTAAGSRHDMNNNIGGSVGGHMTTTNHIETDVERKVYHYPWNSTGFYRGDWKRISTSLVSSSSSTTATLHKNAGENVENARKMTNQQQQKVSSLYWERPKIRKNNKTQKQQRRQQSQRKLSSLSYSEYEEVVSEDEEDAHKSPNQRQQRDQGEDDVEGTFEGSGFQTGTASKLLGLASWNSDRIDTNEITSISKEKTSSYQMNNYDHTVSHDYTKNSTAGKAIIASPSGGDDDDDKRTNNNASSTDDDIVVVTAIDIEEHMINVLQNEKFELFGVHLLPYGYVLETRDDNNLTSNRYEDIRYDQNNNKVIQPSTQKTAASGSSSSRSRNESRLRYNGNNDIGSVGDSTSKAENTDATSTNDKIKKMIKPVTLTCESGRAAFQLFSRSIPGMKELSIVDGFIKLYDSTSPGYSTSKDLLLRVRGVLIHSIGRLSLTSNADISQAAFVMVPSPPSSSSKDEPYPYVKSRIVSLDNNSNDNTSSSRRRRRLLEATNDIKNANIEQIRNDVIELYDEEGIDEVAKTRPASATSSRQQQLLQTNTAWKSLITTPDFFTNDNEEAVLHDDFRHARSNVVYHETDEGKGEEDETDQSLSVQSKDMRNDVGLIHDHEIQLPVMSKHALISREGNDAVHSSSERSETIKYKDDHDYDSYEMHLDSTATSSASNSRKLIQADKSSASTGTDANSESSTSRTISNSVTAKIIPDSTDETKTYIPPWSEIVMPYPYLRDDDDETIRRTRTAAARLMPVRERTLEANAAHCLFEINMDVEPVQWTIGAWRKLISHHLELAKLLNPDRIDPEDEDNYDEFGSGNNNNNREGASVLNLNNNINSAGRKRALNPSRASASRSLSNFRKALEDQALVMTMLGEIRSPNCDFAAQLNVTALRTDWEATTSKAISYSFYMMLVCLTQILVLLRQLLHSQSNSTARRVSILCIGWQTVIDALLCLAHIYLSLAVQPLFTAFASVAFFKLLIFCVIEMKYMTIITQARNSNAGAAQSAEVLRREVAMLHLRFYVALMIIFVMLLYLSDSYRLPFILALYSFWVPQIILNIITEAKAPMHRYYVYGMSLTRLVVPLYMLAVPSNFLKQVYPDTPSDVFTCEMLILWIGIQTAVLVGQSKYGARFMIPARFLPPKFDYSRPIPPSMLPPGASAAILLHDQVMTTTSETMDDRYDAKLPSASTMSSPLPSSTSVLIDDAQVTTQAHRERHNTTAITTRNRIRGNRNNGGSVMTTEDHTIRRPAVLSSASLPSGDSHVNATSIRQPTAPIQSTLVPPQCCLMECSICYDGIDIRKRMEYMLAPCNHLFHRACLSQWMDVKMECPICRTELPAT